MTTNTNLAKIHKPTLSYTLFLHLMQLRIRNKRTIGRRRDRHPGLPLIKSKILVTDTLISESKIQSESDMEALKQEQVFNNRLKLSMLRMSSLRNSRLLRRKEKAFRLAVIR
uniref:Uncharacterized protein n=1 Tax=Bactrocera latifrons TaxID=174628 RepID=A0A0K8TVM9_BACLA